MEDTYLPIPSLNFVKIEENHIESNEIGKQFRTKSFAYKKNKKKRTSHKKFK